MYGHILLYQTFEWEWKWCMGAGVVYVDTHLVAQFGGSIRCINIGGRKINKYIFKIT